jgi:hypothetical protein
MQLLVNNTISAGKAMEEVLLYDPQPSTMPKHDIRFSN